ncbi:MAG: NUDIX domain-containing protein [Candidatus Woesearchaeota archaeon]|jgi:ADP-ribose pyrophosphatase YjhB (NUDIX family)
MDIRKQILQKFMYNKSMKYNEIRDQVPSNKFNYYLKLLLNEELIEQTKDKYNLTPKGTQHISSLDGLKIEENRKPIVCAFVMAYKNGKILVNERKKQPFMGYVGSPGGKIDFGNSIPEQAAQELLEETGLVASKMELKLITNYRTLDKKKNELTHQVIGFFYLATGIKGILKEEDREGRNFFMTLNQIKRAKKYPDFDFHIKTILGSKKLVFKEAIRYIEDEEFTGIDFLD